MYVNIFCTYIQDRGGKGSEEFPYNSSTFKVFRRVF